MSSCPVGLERRMSSWEKPTFQAHVYQGRSLALQKKLAEIGFFYDLILYVGFS